MRSLVAWDAGAEGAFQGFHADHLMAAAAAVERERALLRMWTRPQAALSVGRFHRVDPAGGGMQRRLSGGHIVAVGPGIVGITLAVSSGAWLNAGGAELRPDQILNRALRPVLALLRGLGVDAFYPGRDVVTAGGRTLLYASFCPFPDGVILVEQLLALERSLAVPGSEWSRLDPNGVAAGDRSAFAGAAALGELAELPGHAALLERITEAAVKPFACDVVCSAAEPVDLAAAFGPDQTAYAAFIAERGPPKAGHETVAAISMLGAVELSARREGGGLRDVEITGDLIAPFRTVEDLERACETGSSSGDGARAALAEVLGDGRNFVLGGVDFGELAARLA